eukprot:1841795-Pleurochrysis_carterae.AAC.3
MDSLNAQTHNMRFQQAPCCLHLWKLWHRASYGPEELQETRHKCLTTLRVERDSACVRAGCRCQCSVLAAGPLVASVVRLAPAQRARCKGSGDSVISAEAVAERE